MAYIVARTSVSAASAATSLTGAIPPHETNDLILVLTQQDGGTGTLSVSGYTGIGSQSNNAGVSSRWWYKIAASGSESAPAMSSTISDEMFIATVIVRDADTSTPIHSSAVNTGNSPLASPSLTTTVDGCLLIYSWHIDSAANYTNLAPAKVIPFRTEGNTGSTYAVLGYAGQVTAGACPSETETADLSDGGSAWIIAVKNKSGGAIAPAITTAAAFLYKGCSNGAGTDPTRTVLSTLTSTINGITVNSAATNTYSSIALPGSPWGQFRWLTWNNSVASEWVGAYFTISSINLTGKHFAVEWAPYAAPNLTGSEGYIIVFGDASGNWVAYQLASYLTQPPADSPVNSIILQGQSAVYASSGTLDWTAITKLGFGHHRVGSAASSRGLSVKRVLMMDAIVGVGGSFTAPLSPSIFGDTFSQLPQGRPIDKQGKAQVLTRVPIQIGNGSTATYFRAFGGGLEEPESYGANNPYWQIPDEHTDVTVYASASDVIDFKASILSTASKQHFRIHAASSTSATYDFAGCAIVGYEVAWQAGITANGATFARCYQIVANGGSFAGCTVQRSLATSAIVTADPGEISDCHFVEGAAGHAIEITTPGTYTFSGNTFAGYGADGTTDAAVYNNSGGAVTLNISGGGDTPTVRNGAGASTIVSAGAVVTFDGINAGSEIRVFSLAGVARAGVETCDANHVLSFDVYGAPETVVIRIVNVLYKIKEFTAKVSVGSLTIPVQQEIDPWYHNP